MREAGPFRDFVSDQTHVRFQPSDAHDVQIKQPGRHSPRRAIMKRLLLIAAISAVSLSGAVAKATELPSYELMGFPISRTSSRSLGRPISRSNHPAPR